MDGLAGVPALIRKVFSDVERDYGYKLVRFAMGFLTFSVRGVSDAEMKDLQSLHDEVLDFVFGYSAVYPQTTQPRLVAN